MKKGYWVVTFDNDGNNGFWDFGKKCDLVQYSDPNYVKFIHSKTNRRLALIPRNRIKAIKWVEEEIDDDLS